MSKLISVIMPVYNSEVTVGEALRSIFDQRYKHLELIIVDDKCTDATMDVVYSFKDHRVHVIKNSHNIGLAASLNKAVSMASGEYIARMDADDVCFAQRLERQIDFMDRNHHIDVLGTAMQYFGFSRFKNVFPKNHDLCKAQLLFNVCFGHPTVMFRKHVFERYRYNETLKQYGEEYDLWCRLMLNFEFANLDEVLLKYRTYPIAMKTTAEMLRRANSIRIRNSYLRSLWTDVSDEDLTIHNSFAGMEQVKSLKQLSTVHAWLKKIVSLNNRVRALDASSLNKIIAHRFYEYCYSAHAIGWAALRFYNDSDWAQYYKSPTMQAYKYAARVLMNKLK